MGPRCRSWSDPTPKHRLRPPESTFGADRGSNSALNNIRGYSPDYSARKPTWTASAPHGRAQQRRLQRRRLPGATARRAVARANPAAARRRDTGQYALSAKRCEGARNPARECWIRVPLPPPPCRNTLQHSPFRSATRGYPSCGRASFPRGGLPEGGGRLPDRDQSSHFY
jgi:hypothetical protein